MLLLLLLYKIEYMSIRSTSFPQKNHLIIHANIIYHMLFIDVLIRIYQIIIYYDTKILENSITVVYI